MTLCRPYVRVYAEPSIIGNRGLWVYVFMHSMYVYMHSMYACICMCVCMNVCVYACMIACVYNCMCV